MAQLSYTMDKDDLRVFMQHYSDSSPLVKQARTRLAAIVAIGFLIVYLFPREEWPEPIYMVTAFFIGLFVVTWISRRKPKVSLRQIDTMFPAEENKGIFGGHALELGENSLIEHSDTGEQHSTYASLQKVERTPSHTFIYISSTHAHVIPHNKISEGNLETFLKGLKERVDKTQE